jgi:hypothetical protein
MEVLLVFPERDNPLLTPAEVCEILVEVAGMKYKVAVYTYDRKFKPPTQLLMENDT